jgi:hypothetical protein
MSQTARHAFPTICPSSLPPGVIPHNSQNQSAFLIRSPDIRMFALLLCFALVSISVMTHYETLRLMNDHLGSTRAFSERAKVLAALVGLLMVSWTASFTYLEMRRYW